MIVSMWITTSNGSPSASKSGSTHHILVLTSGSSPISKNQWTRAQRQVLLWCLNKKKKKLDSCNVKPTHTSNIWISNHKGSITAGDLELPHLGVECTHSLSMPWTLQISLGAWRMLWFNLFRVEIRELRPKVVAESDEVLVHYRSRTNVWRGLSTKTLA